MTPSLSGRSKSANPQSYSPRVHVDDGNGLCRECESIRNMPTCCGPTESRGKRVVYKSTDPDEPKRNRRTMLVFFGVVAFLYSSQAR